MFNNEFRVIPETARHGFENTLPFKTLMLFTVQATEAYAGWKMNGLPAMGIVSKHDELDIHNWYKQLRDILFQSTTLNGEPLFPSDLDLHIAECWALKSRVPYSTFYNAVTNGRYSEEVFHRAGEREDFIIAIVNDQFMAPVIDHVAKRLERR